MNAGTGVPNMKWGAQISNVGVGTPVTLLATALLVVNLVRTVPSVKFICCC